MSKKVSLEDFSAEMQGMFPMFLRAMFRRERNAISQGVITVPQFLGLSFLRVKPNSPVKAFAETLGLQLSSASGLLDRLAKLGLLKRTHSTEDRRVVLLMLTRKGEEMVDEIMKQKRHSVAEIFSALSDDERSVYLELMQKVMERINE